MNHSWMEEFEKHLQRLEQAVAATSADLRATVVAATDAIDCLFEHPVTEIWVLQADTVHRLTDGQMQGVPPEQQSSFERLADRQSQWIDRSQFSAFPDGGDKTSTKVLITRYPLAESQEIIVGTGGSQLYGSKADAEQATLAVTSVLAAQLTQHLLSTATKSTNILTALLQFAAKLQGCGDAMSLQQVIAQESGSIWPHCRTAALAVEGGRHHLKSITGAGQINHQSAQVQAMESLANFLVADQLQQQPQHSASLKWITIQELESFLQQSDDTAEWRQLTDDYRTAGVHFIGVVPIHQNQKHVLTVLLESKEAELSDSEPKSGWSDAIQLATNRILNGERNRRSWKRLPLPLTAGIILLLTVISFFIPTGFELTVTGQLVARGRRSIFASESGTVTTVHFINEQKVDAAAALITLANPELQQRASELNGEIATSKAAVAAVNVRRTSQASEGLAAEGQVLRQRLKSLEAERQLIDERISSLSIRAPFAGYIVRRDAVQDLTNRPLQRGQRIAELIPLEAKWELELHVPQSYFHYFQTALAKQQDGLPLRYIISSEPNRTHSATLESIEHFTYSRNTQLVQNASVSVLLADTSNVKSGTSVSARISCGQRSLGFVATRRLIEFIQHLKFVWWS